MPRPARQQRFPNHLPEKRARVKVFGRCEVLKRPRQRLPRHRWPIGFLLRHLRSVLRLDAVGKGKLHLCARGCNSNLAAGLRLRSNDFQPAGRSPGWRAADWKRRPIQTSRKTFCLNLAGGVGENEAGTRGGGRTHNLRLRRPTLYPIELLAQVDLTVGQTGRLGNPILSPGAAGDPARLSCRRRDRRAPPPQEGGAPASKRPLC